MPDEPTCFSGEFLATGLGKNLRPFLVEDEPPGELRPYLGDARVDPGDPRGTAKLLGVALEEGRLVGDGSLMLAATDKARVL